MKKSVKSEPVVVLPPPVFEVSPASNKYELVVILRWHSFEKVIKIDKEVFGDFNLHLVDALNTALLEASEAKPYLVK